VNCNVWTIIVIIRALTSLRLNQRSAKTTSRKSNTALRMSYYDPEWDGPPFDPRMPPPLMPPYMRGPRGYRMPPGRPLSEIAEDANSNRYNAGNDNRFRRNPGGRGRIPNGPMGGGPMGYPGPFGRDDAPGRTSLKDMAMRSTTSFDKQIIQSMNTRPNARAGSPPVLPDTTEATSTSSQYVPLNAVAADRAPPLNVQPPVPRPDPYMEMRDMPSSEMPPTIHVSRNVRPSVVLVTSKGVGNANSQGSGFIVEFGEDDAALDVDKDTCHILTSAHVAPPGWKVSVTFPNDPDKEYSAEVVGRKLNSDLALLRVETNADDNEDYPFPPPLMLSSEDVFTSIGVENDRPPLAEIGSPVYAFGYPMGVEGPTMTSGILSATTKGINYMDAPTGEEGTEKSRPFEKTSFVITDAAMAGGMSGGPLVNYNGVVVGVNALVRPDLRALGNYAVSSVECEEFLEKLEDQNSGDSVRSSRKASVARPVVETDTEGRRNKRAPQEPVVGSNADDVAGFRVMLYGYSTSKDEAGKILRRLAGLDQNRAENALRSATSFGAGVVDEFYVSGSRGGPKAAQKSAESLKAKLESEGLMAVVEPLHILN
jgi:S1-C subfamily serine protease